MPIKPDTTYYFSYYVSSWGSVANSSVRFGAVNSSAFCGENGDISWSGQGGERVGSYNGNNMSQKGSWTKKEGYIVSGSDADYFFFNLYWLQDTDFVCINGFTLREVEPLTPVSVERPEVRVYAGESPALPSRLKAEFDGGEEADLRVVWDGLDTTRDGEYTVGGELVLPGGRYGVDAAVTVYSDSLSPDYTIARDFGERNGEAAADFGIWSDAGGRALAALAIYDSEGRLNSVSVNTDAKGRFSLTLPAPVREGFTARTYVWDAATLRPLASFGAESIISEEGGGFMPVSDVTLLDGMFKTARDLNEVYLMNVDPDRLLAPSMEAAGLEPKAERYGGWEAQGHAGLPENMGISGHSLGHWLSAVSTASVESQRFGEELTERLNYAVSELARIQTETGSGYIGGLSSAPFEQAFAGSINTPGGFNLNGAWVPWYSVHKIYQGLIDAYRIAGCDQALDVVKRFADWAVDGTAALTDEQMQKMLGVEHGGMNDVFAQLYEITGDERFLDAAVRFTHNAIVDPLAEGKDELTGKHANTQIPKIIGAAAIYEQNGDLTAYRDAARFFWDRVVNSRSFVIGGNSVAEHFEADGAETLDIKDAETCNTFNMIKLTEHLYSWEHRSEYMDYVETALYNDILGAQDPDTGNKMYFTSMRQGHFRIYGTPENSWWCCTGSGMENPGRYSKVIYYKDRADLYVNLYIPSQVRWKETGLTFRMETDFPYSDTVTFKAVNGGGEAAVRFRAPKWLDGEMTLTLNGEKLDAAVENGYVTVERFWNEGDAVELTLPMGLSLYTARDSESKVVYRYGPIVLAADLGDELEGFDLHGEETRENETSLPANSVAVPLLKTDGTDPLGIIKADDLSTLSFSIDGAYTSNGQELKLRPFYSIHHRFHNVYWYLDAEPDPYARALDEITVDSVIPDGQQDELGHAMKHNDDGKTHNGTHVLGTTTYFWRDAYGAAESWFSYELKVDPKAKNYLYVSYFGDDGPFNGYSRSFTISADGEKIADQTLNMEKPNGMFNKFYEIPESVTAGKQKITVRFAANGASCCAGGVTNVRITRAGEVDVRN